jgi:O-antigen/teichoic acid export membrane protein
MINLEASSARDDPAIETNQAAKKHLRGSTLLLAGRLISMAANFVIQIMIVRYLSKNDYGAFAYGLSIVSLGNHRTGHRVIALLPNLVMAVGACCFMIYRTVEGIVNNILTRLEETMSKLTYNLLSVAAGVALLWSSGDVDS